MRNNKEMLKFFILQLFAIMFCQSIVFAQSSAPGSSEWLPPSDRDDAATRSAKLTEANLLCVQIRDRMWRPGSRDPGPMGGPIPLYNQLRSEFPQFGADRLRLTMFRIFLYDREVRSILGRPRPTPDQVHAECMAKVTEPRRSDRRPAQIQEAQDLGADYDPGNEEMADNASSASENEEMARACDVIRQDDNCNIPQGNFDFDHMRVIMEASEQAFNFTAAPAISPTDVSATVVGNISAFLGLNREQRRNLARTACNCAHKLIQDDPAIKAQIDAEKVKIEAAFAKRLNQKFLNDFSQQFEDISFLGRHRAQSLGRNPQGLLCNDKRFFERIADGNARCTLNGINEAERRQRIDALFNSLETPFPGRTVSERLQSIEDQTKTVTVSSTGLPAGAQTRFTRDEFDQIRHGMARENKYVLGINNVLTRLIKDPGFGNFMQTNVGVDPRKIFESYLQTKDAAFIASLVADADPEFRSRFTAKPVEYFGEAVIYAGNISPGIKVLMNHSSVLGEIADKLDNRRNQKDVIQLLDTESGILGDYYKEKCDEIKENFSNIVCGDTEKLVKDADPEDMEQLILANNREAGNPQIDTRLGKMSFCKNNRNKLDISLDQPGSSLRQRIAGQEEFFGTAMSKYAKNDPEYVKYLTGFATRNTGNSDSASDPTFVAQTTGTTLPGAPEVPIFNRVTSDGRVDFTSNNRSFAFNQSGGLSSQSSPSRSIASTSAASSYTEPVSTSRTVAPETSDGSSFVPSSSYSSPATVVQAQTPSSAARETLRESLSNGSNNSQVARQIASLPDSMVDELSALRKDLETEQKRLSEVNTQVQETRVRQLENELKQLQERRDTIVQSAPETPAPTSNEFVVSGGSSVAASRAVASNGVVAPQTTSGNLGGSTNLPGAPQTSAPEQRTDGQVSGNPSRSTDASNISPLVVTSNAVKSGDANLDVNQEVLRFLTTNDPDLTVLNQIKDKGFVYRYKVIKNGQEVFEEVFIRFDGLSESARQALEQKIARRRSQNPALARVEDEIRTVERRHSYESLKLIMGQQVIVRQ